MIELEQLRLRASDALQGIPGATALYAFGSLVTGKADRYSDIDLEIITTDLQAAVDGRHAIWARVGPVELEWRIHPSRSGWAATLLFANASPYHKIDIGISEASANTGDLFGASELLWRQEPTTPLLALSEPGGFIPAAATPDHAVIDQLLGATRYVKARKRGQHLTCYRFASALANAVMSLLYARQTGDPADVHQKVSTSGYLCLDESHPAEERLVLLADMDFSSPRQMDRAVCTLLRRSLGLLGHVPDAGAIPGSLVDRLLRFIESELVDTDHQSLDRSLRR